MLRIRLGRFRNTVEGISMNSSVVTRPPIFLELLEIKKINNAQTRVMITKAIEGMKYLALSNREKVSLCPSAENNILSTKNDAIDLKLPPKSIKNPMTATITIVFLEGGLSCVCVRTLLAMRTC